MVHIMYSSFAKFFKFFFSEYQIHRILIAVKKIFIKLKLPIEFKGSMDAKYWESRSSQTAHPPESYLKPDQTTESLLHEVIENLEKNSNILEIGCNAGRNLKYLSDKGFQNLYGTDINEPAINTTLKREFPELFNAADLRVGNAAKVIKEYEDSFFDLVYSNAVLIHINPSDFSLFEDMVRVSNKYIAIFTTDNAKYTWPYDFTKIFENLGCTEILKKVYYGKNSVDCKLPKELFKPEEHFFVACSVRVFIKNQY